MREIYFKFVTLTVVWLAFGTSETLASIFEGAGRGQTDTQAGSSMIGDQLAGTGITPQDGNLTNLILTFVNFMLPYLALAAFIGYVYAGILWVVNVGNEEFITKAKKIIVYSTIGLIVVILSFAIVRFLTSDLTEFINR